MPSLTHQALSFERPAGAVDENGVPLSVWMTVGRPNSRNADSKEAFAAPEGLKAKRLHWPDIPDFISYAANLSIVPWESCFTDPVDELVLFVGTGM